MEFMAKLNARLHMEVIIILGAKSKIISLELYANHSRAISYKILKNKSPRKGKQVQSNMCSFKKYS